MNTISYQSGRDHQAGQRPETPCSNEDLYARNSQDILVLYTEIENILAGLKKENEELKRVRYMPQTAPETYAGSTGLGGQITFSRDFVVRSVTPPAAELFGIDPVQLKGLPFHTFIAPCSRRQFFHFKENLRYSKTSQTWRLTMKCYNGREFFAQIECTPLKDAAEDGFLAVVSDITRLHMAEQERRQEMIRVIIENIYDPCKVLRAVRGQTGDIVDFVYEYVNAEACRVIGRSRPEIIGISVLETNPELKKNGYFDQLCHVVNAGLAADVEKYCYAGAPGGKDLNSAFAAKVTKLNDGVMITWRDDRESKKREEEFSYQTKLLDNVYDAVIALDNDLNIVHWNRAAEVIYGWKKNEVLGRKMAEIVKSELTHSERSLIIDKLKRQDCLVTESVHYNKKGERLYIESTSMVIRDKEGNPQGNVCVNRDVSERMRTIAELKKEKENLEALSEMSEAFASISSDYKEILDYTTQKLACLLGDACIIRLIDEESGNLYEQSFFHPDAEILEFMRGMFCREDYNIHEGIHGCVIANRRPVRISDLEINTQGVVVKGGYAQYALKYGFSSLIILPLLTRNKVIGTLSLSRSKPGRPYTEADQSFLQSAAAKISLAISNAWLLNDKLREIEERKKTEARLKAQQDLLEAVLESIPVGVW
ncbi:MAG: PAS domain S-box protein, partial [Methanococcaceae archaeon]